MEYIDAEKLIAEIERYEKTAIDAYNPNGEDADFWYGKVVACGDFKTFVTSRKQEQVDVDLDNFVKEEFNKYSCVDGYGQLSVSYNMAEFYSMIKRLLKYKKEN